jgi:hypothetical protein
MGGLIFVTITKQEDIDFDWENTNKNPSH